MKLYEAVGSPSPRRVRVVLAEKGLLDEVERVEVDLGQRAQFGPAFRAINPACTVPVLELDDGNRLTDSHAIARYLDAAYPDPSLFGTDPVSVATITAWCRRVDLELYLPAADALRNGHPRFEGRALPGWEANLPQIPALVDRAKRVTERFLADADAALARRPHLALGAFTMADVDLLIATDFAARVGLAPTADRPALASWHARMTARPSASA